jgi:hypothetical protein
MQQNYPAIKYVELKAGMHAGGSASRNRIAQILGFTVSGNHQYAIHAAAVSSHSITFEIGCSDGNFVFIAEPAKSRDRHYFLQFNDFGIYYQGSEIPRDLQEHLAKFAFPALSELSFIDLQNIFINDPDLGRPVEKMPSSNEAGEQKFKSKALLSSWGSSSLWYNFFAAAEIARCQLDSLDFFDTCRFIQHCDNECIFVSPELGVPIMEMVYFPWKDRLRNLTTPAGSTGRTDEKNDVKSSGRLDEFKMYMTDLDEYDIVMGKSNDKLINALEHATSQPHDSFTLCSNTCVPIVAGEDVESIVKRYQKKSTSPLLFLTCTANSMENLFHNVLVKYKNECKKGTPQTDSASDGINFV